MLPRPLLPYVLGLAGLIPFVAFAVLVLVNSDPASAPVLRLYLATYGAVILSFLGGTRWGAEIRHSPDRPNAVVLCLAMAPPLAGWAAILPIMWDRWYLVFGLLAGGLVLQLAWDMVAVRKREFPAWYLPLRIILTSVAVISLSAAAIH